MNSVEQKIFEKGSTTYYFSSKFFPVHIREDVFRLYSFVRVADDYVDSIPPQTDKFRNLRKSWVLALKKPDFNTMVNKEDTIDQRVIKNMMHVSRKYNFDPGWTDSFLESMQADIDKKSYQNIDDTLWYMYGSAEVIGLMMSKIMGLTDEAQHNAQMQGRAMQFINFLRDIDEDNNLGRCYFPKEDLEKFGLTDLINPPKEKFVAFMHYELKRYKNWQKEADEGLKFIPRRLQVPLQTATDMYNWTAAQIERNPLIVFERKIKPRKRRVLLRATQHLLIKSTRDSSGG